MHMCITATIMIIVTRLMYKYLDTHVLEFIYSAFDFRPSLAGESGSKDVPRSSMPDRDDRSLTRREQQTVRRTGPS